MQRLLVSVLLLGAIALPLASARAGSSSTTDPIALLDEVLAAYGGADRLEKVKGYRMEGAMQAKTRGATATTTRVFGRPGDFRVDLRYPDFTEVRVVKGGQGWRSGASGINEVKGPMLDSMALQAARAAIPWVLQEHRAKLRPAAPADVEGQELPGVEIALSDALTLRAWVDPKTSMVVRTQSVMASLEMSMEFSTVYSDWRPVDGLVFAFHEENFAGTTHTGSTFITSVTLDPPGGVEVPAFDPSMAPPVSPGATNPHVPGGGGNNPHGGANPKIPL